MEQNLTILCRSLVFPNLALPDKANQIKIGQEMREKKQFLLFLE